MSLPPLINQFSYDLNSVVDKYRDQGLTTGEAIGAIEILKLQLFNEIDDDDAEYFDW